MADTRRAHHLPIMFVERALVADAQRTQQPSGMRVIRQRGVDRVADPGAYAIDTCAVIEHRVGGVLADVTGGNDALLQRRPLEIETPRIDHSVRPFHPYPQPPLRARSNGRRRMSARRVPGQVYVTVHWHSLTLKARIRDLEVETSRVILYLRQIGHRSGNEDVLLFECVLKTRVQREIRATRGPLEGSQQDRQAPKPSGEAPAQTDCESREGDAAQRYVEPMGRQCGQRLHQDGTRENRQCAGQDTWRGLVGAAFPARGHRIVSRRAATDEVRRRSIPAPGPDAGRDCDRG